ncbi:MAG: dCTP deaminase domain-containing protein [Fusobacteriaceae bacterium]
MILKSDLIKQKEIIVDGFHESLLGPISHDLTIEKILISTKEQAGSYELQPQKTIYIECGQTIKLPNDLIGFVHGKNSRIRQGLEVTSPIYQPGHHTKIFLRITNVSSDVIYLKAGDKIAQISFSELNGDKNKKYEGVFENEFSYIGLGKYDDEYVSRKIEDKIEKIEDIERKIYSGVATIVTVLIALFGFFNAGIKIQQDTNIANVFFMMSLSLIGLTTLLFGVIGIFFSKRAKESSFCLVVSILAFSILYCFTK